MYNILFFTALSLFFTHQIDTIRCKEWRFLPGFSKLNDKIAEQLFIVTHIPVFVIIFVFLTHVNFIINEKF